jgi:hypothetical protein
MYRIRQNVLKTVHITSTLFFAASACYLLVTSIYHAAGNTMLTTPLSAYSVPIIFLLITWYLFAVYRGISRDQKIEIEHPLTTAGFYLFFYKLTPLLGAIAGVMAAWGIFDSDFFLLITAGGAVFTTFLVWIFVDPLVGMLEMLLPSSRRHRGKRLARSRAEYKKQCLARQSILKELEKIEEVQQRQWDQTLMPLAHKLAELICFNHAAIDACRAEAVDIGVRLWQYGGLECMKYIHSKAMDICRDECRQIDNFGSISCWWQGIGTWRNPSDVNMVFST